MERKTPTILFLLLLILSLCFSAVNAQITAYAEITTPTLNTFPELVFYLDAFGPEGEFLSGLTKDQITLLENGKNVSPDRVSKLITPLNFILSINSSPALGNRDVNAVTRYEKVVNHLTTWVNSLPTTTPDQFAITWNGGTIGSEMDRAAFLEKLIDFDIHSRESTGTMEALSYALDQAEKVDAKPGAKRSILFVTGRLSVAEQEALRPLVERAVKSQTRVYVIVTDSADFKALPSVTSLDELAVRSGGRSVLFSGAQELPNLTQWFATLSQVYEVTYASLIREAGAHSLSVQIDQQDLTLSSNLVSFDLKLAPINIALLSPPIEVVRDDPKRGMDIQKYVPKEIPLHILVEYPDGRQRGIAYSELIVDGEVVVSNTTEPFDRFVWDVSGYIASADHHVSARVVDVLGLEAFSTEVPILVTVVPPPGGFLAVILTNKLASALAATSILLAIALWLVSKRKANLTKKIKDQKAEPVAELRSAQPAAPVVEPEPAPIDLAANPQAVNLSNFSAWLVPLNDEDQPSGDERIVLKDVPLRVGSGAENELVLSDRSVTKYHALIEREVDGTFTIADQKTLTGTWIDHQSVHGKGKALTHGCLLHFGRLGYRYEDDRAR